MSHLNGNRKERRAQQAEQRTYVKSFPDQLTPVPESEWPQPNGGKSPVAIWRSRHYLVQAYREDTPAYPGMLRLSINRSTVGLNGRWDADLTWDELQQIKRDIGLGDYYAVEVYPRDRDMINVANIRHLWLIRVPLEIGWFK